MGEQVSGAKKQLVTELMRMQKGVHRMKAAATQEIPDKAAYGLLFPLLHEDLRASKLAELVHTDPSTASRHIATLVDQGLAKRVADQNDGRATLLSVTEEGRTFCVAVRDQREAGMAQLLANWSDADAEQFATLLLRFNNDIEANFQNVVDGMRAAFDRAAASTNSEDQSSPDKETV